MSTTIKLAELMLSLLALAAALAAIHLAVYGGRHKR
jgi:hypothetical protein